MFHYAPTWYSCFLVDHSAAVRILKSFLFVFRENKYRSLLCFYFYILNSIKIKDTEKHPLKSQRTALFRRGKKKTGLRLLAVQGSVLLPCQRKY